ncbi:MAG: hypothetical protein WBQ94_00030, partial [Terracidiphilus sp.]
MARTTSIYGGAVAVARARRDKAMLLPLPRSTVDDLSLRYHIALESMRTGQGYPAAVHTLTAVML